VFDGQDPLMERRLVVAGEDRHGLLGDDRSTVEGRIDEVDGRPGHGRAMGKGVANGMRAREGRQQRRVGVEDPARVTGEDA